MIIQLTQSELSIFAQSGVAFSRTYAGAIPRLLAAEIAQMSTAQNFFFKQGGKATYFVYKINNKIIGRIAAFVNPTIKDNGAQVGCIGMFDSIEDYSIACELFEVAVAYLRTHNCKHIWGPIDFSIWHNYRLMTQGFGSRGFLGEPRNPPYYPAFFERYGFSVRNNWESQVLDHAAMANFIAANKGHLTLAHKLGYTFVQLNKANQDELMRVTYRILTESYQYFPGFNDISEQDFLLHFKHMPSVLDIRCSQFVKNPDGKYLGFLLVFKDLYAPLVAMNGSTHFWAKIKYLLHQHQTEMANIAQGGTLPFFIREAAVLSKKHGGAPLTLAGATLCNALENIVRTKKYKQTIISLMREGAAIKNHASDITTERRTYALYELKNNVC